MLIEDYGLVGDLRAAALVGRNGSVDWLCLPRFDSASCFSALLGDEQHGRWLLAPAGEVRTTSRRYRPDTLVLDTEFETAEGVVRVTDFMPPRGDGPPRFMRIVEGLRGRVPMRLELVLRPDYGSIAPWTELVPDGAMATAGVDAYRLSTPLPLSLQAGTVIAEFDAIEGARERFTLTWHPAHRETPPVEDADSALARTVTWWQEWTGRSNYDGAYRDEVTRSLIILKAMTYEPTGALIAAPTTSLPEDIGGIRNWDYRYCWLRDSTFTLYALMLAGLAGEARAWREWLLRAVAGQPKQMQILYGVAGERRISEQELPWLPGYQGARPVRIGNAAVEQFQLDVYGEVMDTLHLGRRIGLESDEVAWDLQRALMEFLEGHWREPDEGIWEIRGPRRHFTHSKVMAWVALDRAVKAVELAGLEGPLDRWRALRREIHEEVCREGFDAERDAFVQFYGSKHLDASLLLIPLVGFLPATDPRVKATVAAIQRELVVDGLVHRYPPEGSEHVDGLPPGEGAFLACTFWLADNLALMGRADEAREIFERMLELRNDVGLLAEEFDPGTGRQLGNFPQAFSHVALVNTARNLSELPGPAWTRYAG